MTFGAFWQKSCALRNLLFVRVTNVRLFQIRFRQPTRTDPAVLWSNHATRWIKAHTRETMTSKLSASRFVISEKPNFWNEILFARPEINTGIQPIIFLFKCARYFHRPIREISADDIWILVGLPEWCTCKPRPMITWDSWKSNRQK